LSGAQGEITSLVMSADGARVLATCTGDKGGQAVLWDVESREVAKAHEEKDTHAVRGATLARDGKTAYFVTTVTREEGWGELIQSDLATGHLVRDLPPLNGIFRTACLLPDGRLAVVGDSGLILYDPAGKKGVTSRPADHKSFAM